MPAQENEQLTKVQSEYKKKFTRFMIVAVMFGLVVGCILLYGKNWFISNAEALLGRSTTSELLTYVTMAPFVIGILAALVLILLFALLSYIRCPSCQGRIHSVTLVNFCPKCGILLQKINR